ncbi:hypothetical protein PPMP20_03855 [Paraburkholderia phymatum]|uniref:Uncharacterized protein n=1 Tax=Paraburkholderia phymatum (strain DSM 17167 / CIP 108236 / LMG 21445 / STM815) TaxID=391038 RepID=B2JSL9_PARP8|nr:hypothetical protein [Paraburkholderia phymatum]ACC75572.1 hypothetical protein Bphy_6544 [Paraburkholderia phymatum STM815]
MAYYYVEPEVAGGLGKNTVLDLSVHPPAITRLHYRIINWLGDALLESFPALIVTREAAGALNELNASGYECREMELTVSESFREVYPERTLPEFLWLSVTGVAGRNDFGLAADSRLVVSERVLHVLKTFGLNHAIVEDY